VAQRKFAGGSPKGNSTGTYATRIDEGIMRWARFAWRVEIEKQERKLYTISPLL
jgi:hypothetical protein